MDRRKILWVILLTGLAIIAWWLDHTRPFPAHVIRNGPRRAAGQVSPPLTHQYGV